MLLTSLFDYAWQLRQLILLWTDSKLSVVTTTWNSTPQQLVASASAIAPRLWVGDKSDLMYISSSGSVQTSNLRVSLWVHVTERIVLT